MKVAEKDGEKKTKNKKQQEKGRVLCRVDRVGRNKKKETKKKGENKGEEIPLCQKCLSCYAWKFILKVQVS